MRIWPVLLDHHPAYLGSRGRNASLLLLPLGSQTLIEHLRDQLEPLTTRRLLVIADGAAEPEYGDWIRAVCPTANVLTSATALADAVATFELSDALLILDPRHLLLRASDLASLVEHFAEEPRVSHCLVAFKSSVGGTLERVSFDAAGDVRRILRHYEPATWPFIAGVPAILVSVASGILAEGVTPTSLAELRQTLTARGVPSRDVPVNRGAFDLSQPPSLLAANEYFVRKVTSVGEDRSAPAPLFIGSGHSVHKTARLTGPVVIHPGAVIDENALVLGPAVIGARAHVSSGAVVAHGLVGPDCTVPSGVVIRNRVWFEQVGDSPAADYPPQSYPERLARLMTDARSYEDSSPTEGTGTLHRLHHPFKRALDITVAALALLALSPLLLLVTAVIWLQSKGPVFYGDEREGLGGRVFRCWKFRTMSVGAHAVQLDLKLLDKMDGPHFKLDRDPRVTRVGRVLRALNLDELPQLFNVWSGDMSLVGPRPSPFRENQVCIPWREARLSVRPGITGFWQVCRHDRSDGDFHQWIEYDLLYVQHMSLWLDVKIVLATMLTLGGKFGHVPASWLVSSASIEGDLVPSPADLISDVDPLVAASGAVVDGSRPINRIPEPALVRVVAERHAARYTSNSLAEALTARPAALSRGTSDAEEPVGASLM